MRGRDAIGGDGSTDQALRMRGATRVAGDVESGIALGDFPHGDTAASLSSPIEAAKRANSNGTNDTGHSGHPVNSAPAKLWGFPLQMAGKDLALFLGTGALLSYLGFTATQESVFHGAGPGGFKHGGAVTLVTTLVYGVLAFLERVREGTHSTRTGSWGNYLILALLTSSGMYCTNAALVYINYTTRIVAKSSKVIPTMLIGAVFQHRKYGLKEYASASLLVIGIACFTLGDAASRPDFDPKGVLLITAALFADSFAANFEGTRVTRLSQIPDDC